MGFYLALEVRDVVLGPEMERLSSERDQHYSTDTGD